MTKKFLMPGEGQKPKYRYKDLFFVNIVPEEMRMALFKAANTGMMATRKRMEAINEASAVMRLKYPMLFRPEKDFEKLVKNTNEQFDEKGRYRSYCE